VPFKAKAACRRRIPKQRHRVTNWAEYDAGLCARGSLTVWFTPEAVAAWAATPRSNRGGQPSHSPGRGTGHRVGTVAAIASRLGWTAYLTSRDRRFRHYHVAAHTDREENHDPTGTLITAQTLNGGLDYPDRNKRTVPA
jgi:hypothetical protein